MKTVSILVALATIANAYYNLVTVGLRGCTGCDILMMATALLIAMMLNDSNTRID
jgi:hypothetical protein